ncbi:hypothetical protein [Paenibacillus sp. 1A_MP2]|uniref:hypothetical protein n=1 Tax=Paenibacillus sp. 1A_MP2 TaxID=3457495 RepID=UPI003FCDFB0F
MINLFFGQSVYLSFINDSNQLTYSSLSGLISDLPDEIDDQDYIIDLSTEDWDVRYAADLTAVRGENICSPNEYDEEWTKLFYAALGRSDLSQVETVTMGLPLSLWNNPGVLEGRIKELAGVTQLDGREQHVNIKNLVTYPAIIAAIYDCFLTIQESELKPKSGMPKRYLVMVLFKRCCEWALVEGLTVIEKGIFSFGFSDILLDIRDYYFSKTNKSLSIYDTDVAFHTGKLEIKEGKYESVSSLIEESTERLNSKVKEAINQLKSELNFEKSYLLGEVTSEFISDESTEIVTSPEYAIVRGLYKLNLLMGQSNYVSQ